MEVVFVRFYIMRQVLISCFCICLFVLFHSIPAAAQDTDTNKGSFIKGVARYLSVTDSNYVRKLPFNYMIGLQNTDWFNHHSLGIEKDTVVEFQTDLAYNLGVVLGYKYITVRYTFDISRAVTGKSTDNKQFNFLINTNRLGGEFYYFKNEGGNYVNAYRFGSTREEVNIPFNGLKTKYYGLDLNYYFNARRYSHSAAYSINYVYQQLRSAGSFILGVSYTNQRSVMDFEKLSKAIDFSSLSDFDNLNTQYQALGLNVGYGYNYVFNAHWLANLTEIPSAGFIVSEESDSSDPGSKFVLGNTAKFAVIYRNKRYFGSIDGQFQTGWYFTESYRLGSSLGLFSLSLGMKL